VQLTDGETYSFDDRITCYNSTLELCVTKPLRERKWTLWKVPSDPGKG